MKKVLLIIILCLVVLVGGYWLWQRSDKIDPPATPERSDGGRGRVVKIEITPNATFGELLEAHSDLTAETINQIYQTALPVYDLAKIRAGHFLELTHDKEINLLKEFVYKIDSEEELVVTLRNTRPQRLSVAMTGAAQHPPATPERSDGGRGVTRNNDNEGIASSSTPRNDNLSTPRNNRGENDNSDITQFTALLRPIPYEIKIKTARGKVQSSMYQAALDNQIDERAIIELANMFQWTIDFAQDPRVGDEFVFVYEERYLNSEYRMPGKILAGKYVNDGTVYDHYYFEEDEGNKGYFDAAGNSVQKMFLKAPVEFRYISSGFTTGARWIEAFDIATGHRAIDYATPAGTPIRSVGDGTVNFAGWSSQGYGRLTTIRHNGTYSTNYAHQSKIAVKAGQQVKQGQVIGYVGSTGLSTGPHLHFEMVKNGVKVNPLKEILPPGKPIKTENQERFLEAIKAWQAELES